MTASWSDDFTYRYYTELVQEACRFLTPCLFRELPQQPASGGGQLLLRHDIDCCLEAALRLAEVEYELGVRSTYFVMMRSPLYDPAASSLVNRISDLGHEVGIHFDCPEEQPGDPAAPAAVEAAIREDCSRLEDLLGRSVESLSFHRPVTQLLRGPLRVAGRINAYAAELMGWYLSDSRGAWRVGEPLPEIALARHRRLQLLTHPIWWSEHHMAAEDRLQAFFLSATRGMTSAQRAAFDTGLRETMPGVRRKAATATVEVAVRQRGERERPEAALAFEGAPA